MSLSYLAAYFRFASKISTIACNTAQVARVGTYSLVTLGLVYTFWAHSAHDISAFCIRASTTYSMCWGAVEMVATIPSTLSYFRCRSPVVSSDKVVAVAVGSGPSCVLFGRALGPDGTGAVV